MIRGPALPVTRSLACAGTARESARRLQRRGQCAIIPPFTGRVRNTSGTIATANQARR